MDVVDLQISKLLLSDSRQPYREIAENVNISVNSAHKRIQSLIQDGVINKFRTFIPIEVFNGITILISGRTSINSLQILKKNLNYDKKTYWITLGAGNILYIGGYLSNIQQLDEYLSHVRNIADLSEMEIGIHSTFPISGQISDYNTLDLKILQELQEDSRKSATDIGAVLNISAKTISKHITELKEKGSVIFSIDWIPDKHNDVISFFHIHLKESAHRESIILELYQLYGLNLVYVQNFSNRPLFLFACFWSNSIANLLEIKEKINIHEDIGSIEINIALKGVILPTWRDFVIKEELDKRKQS